MLISATEIYLRRLMEITNDNTMLRRIERICREDGLHNVAHEAAVRLWRNGWRPYRGVRYQGRHRAT